jgi:DNA-binding GntR family transcriptional regulator
LEAVLKKSAEAQAIEILRGEILNGAIKPGARLTEIEFADKLHISRTTLRTALHQLTVEGLIVQTPYTGWSVCTLSAHDAWELYTLRACFEGLAARLTTQFLDAEGRAELELAFARLSQAGSRRSLQRATAADFALHKTIVRLARHRRLAEQYRLVEQQVRLSIASTNALLPDLSSIIDQHEPIVDAILSGRAGQAAELAEAHNHVEGERLCEHLEGRKYSSASSPPRIGSRNL